MLRTRNLTLTSTAQEITINDGINTENTISIQNTHATADAYLGTSNVTSSSYGIELAAGDTWSADLSASDQIFGVGTNTTVAVLILEK
jgi:hypothetical protein